jgi:Zn-dependent protease
MDITQIIQKISVVYPALLIALVLHEYAHAWVARRYGDETSAWSGRLTLNPVAHMDIFGTVLFPLIGIALGGFIFGWAKPVPIDPRNFRDYRRGLFWVSFAGPLANIFLGFFFAIVYVAFSMHVSQSFAFYKPFSGILEALVGINFVLAIFNLIPLPPLDGSKMVESFLGYENLKKYAQLEQWSFFILLFLMFSGALRIIMIPVEGLYGAAIRLAALLLGVN